jgi:DNA-binding NarL/FixJ family response regulator
VRVAIADDQVLLREGLALLLAEAQMDVVLQASDADRLLSGLARTRPNVAVIDIRLPPTFTDEGLRAADAIREAHPEIAVLILSQYLEAAYALRLLERFPGGIGYLLKDRVSQVAVLTDAIDRVAAGECVLDPSIIARLVGKPELAPSLAALTETPDDNRRVLAVLAFLRG